MHSRSRVNDLDYYNAVEEAILRTESQVKTVVRAGGLLFDDPETAAARAHIENYPEGDEGSAPSVRGRFIRTMIDHLAVYVPEAEPLPVRKRHWVFPGANRTACNYLDVGAILPSGEPVGLAATVEEVDCGNCRLVLKKQGG